MPDNRDKEKETPLDRRSADIGIVCTQNAEIKPLVKALDRGRKYVDNGIVFRGGFMEEVIRVAIVEAGTGFARHRAATETLIKEHNPGWILSLGFSAGLTDDLSSGDICLANEICDTHGNSIPVKCTIPERKRIFVRKHVVADSQPQTKSQKQELTESTDALACDTTSLAVAQACRDLSEDDKTIRFLSIRSIIDTHDEEIAEKVRTFLYEPPAAKTSGLMSKVMGRLKRDPELVPWKSRADEQALNLSRFVKGIIKQLGEKLGKSRF